MILLKAFDRVTSLLLGFVYFIQDYFKYNNLNRHSEFKANLKSLYPCLRDRTTTTDFDRHYVYHTAWAIRKVLEINPPKHIDISSSLFFCSTLSASIKTEFYDYRPANLKLSNLSTHFSDLSSLPFDSNSIESLSCMHVIEHVGLGRYGDKVNPSGDTQAFNELKRVVKKGGKLLLVVPIGKERLQFNAHRIYSSSKIKSYFKDWELKEFYLIPDKNFSETPLINPQDEISDKQAYGCGCFLWEKK